MTLVKDRDYWLEHPVCGTMKAKLIIVSENKKSLGFLLPDPVALPNPQGLGISSFLPLMLVDGIYCDIVSGTVWTVMEEEPAVKIPTK